MLTDEEELQVFDGLASKHATWIGSLDMLGILPDAAKLRELGLLEPEPEEEPLPACPACGSNVVPTTGLGLTNGVVHDKNVRCWLNGRKGWYAHEWTRLCAVLALYDGPITRAFAHKSEFSSECIERREHEAKRADALKGDTP